jgi:hypothetical protein
MKAHYNQTIKVVTPFVIRGRWRSTLGARCKKITDPSSVRRGRSLKFAPHNTVRKADTETGPASALRETAMVLTTVPMNYSEVIDWSL